MQVFLLNDLLSGLSSSRVCGPCREINCGVRQSTIEDYLFIYLDELLALANVVQCSGKQCAAVCYYEYREKLI